MPRILDVEFLPNKNVEREKKRASEPPTHPT